MGESVGGTAASIKKMLASQKGQDIAELAVDAIGVYAVADQRAALGAHPEEPPIGPDARPDGGHPAPERPRQHGVRRLQRDPA